MSGEPFNAVPGVTTHEGEGQLPAAAAPRAKGDAAALGEVLRSVRAEPSQRCRGLGRGGGQLGSPHQRRLPSRQSCTG